MSEEMIKWLVSRAEEETEKIRKSIPSRLRAFFMSEGKKKDVVDGVQKSLGKVEMIDEILKEYIRQNTNGQEATQKNS